MLRRRGAMSTGRGKERRGRRGGQEEEVKKKKQQQEKEEEGEKQEVVIFRQMKAEKYVSSVDMHYKE